MVEKEDGSDNSLFSKSLGRRVGVDVFYDLQSISKRTSKFVRRMCVLGTSLEEVRIS